MKIRTSFVTNSSSYSSAEIKIDNPILLEILKKYKDKGAFVTEDFDHGNKIESSEREQKEDYVYDPDVLDELDDTPCALYFYDPEQAEIEFAPKSIEDIVNVILDVIVCEFERDSLKNKDIFDACEKELLARAQEINGNYNEVYWEASNDGYGEAEPPEGEVTSWEFYYKSKCSVVRSPLNSLSCILDPSRSEECNCNQEEHKENSNTEQLPDTVEIIGENVFEDCKNLKTISFSEGLKEIEDEKEERRFNTKYLLFGEYQQERNDTVTPIEWLVLDKQGDCLLLVSKYGLDAKPYNENYEDITWEKCTLRKWLNGEFLTEAFTTEEQQLIADSKVVNSNNSKYGTSGGNDTTDKVFLLSIDEAEKYFPTDEARKCAPTDYADANGAWTSDSDKVDGKATGWWWLRSPGDYCDFAADVSSDGGVYSYGHFVDLSDHMVRPALWINP